MVAAFDAAAFGTFGNDISGGGVTSATLPFTGAAGASLTVGIAVARSAPADTSAWTATVTYNGVTMTSLKQQRPASVTAFQQVYGLIACCDGTAHDIVVTLGGGATACGIAIGGISATGVGAFTGAVGTNGNVANSPAQSVVSAVGDLVCGFFGHGDVISGQSNTSRWIQQIPTNSTAGSNHAGQTAPGAASVAIAAQSSLTDHWSVIGINMQASAGAAVDDNKFNPARFIPPPMRIAMDRFLARWVPTGGEVLEVHPTFAIAAGGGDTRADVGHDAVLVAIAAAGGAPVAVVAKSAVEVAMASGCGSAQSTVAHDAAVVAISSAGGVPVAIVSSGIIIATTGIAAGGGSAQALTGKDVALSAVLSVGGVPMALVARTTPIVALAAAGGAPVAVAGKSMPVVAIVSAGGVPLALTVHDAAVVALLTGGGDARALIAQARAVTAIASAGGAPVSTVARTQAIIAIASAGGVPTALTGSIVDIAITGISAGGGTAHALVTSSRAVTALASAGGAPVGLVAKTSLIVTGLAAAGGVPMATVSRTTAVVAIVSAGGDVRASSLHSTPVAAIVSAGGMPAAGAVVRTAFVVAIVSAGGSPLYVPVGFIGLWNGDLVVQLQWGSHPVVGYYLIPM